MSVVALTTCAILVALNLLLGRLSEKHAREALEAADRRLGIMTEIVEGIKAIKLCGWFRGWGASGFRVQGSGFRVQGLGFRVD